jgi:YD repeat-containing protein
MEKTIIDYKLLKSLDACKSALYRFVNSFPNGLIIPEGTIEIYLPFFRNQIKNYTKFLIDKKIFKDIIINFESDIDDTYLKYTIDSNGNLINTIDSSGRIENMIYNSDNYILEHITTESNSDYKLVEKYTYNKDNQIIRCETSDGYWGETKYNNKGLKTEYRNSDGYSFKWEFNSDGKVISYHDNNSYLRKWKYDSKGRMISCENAIGLIQKYEYSPDGKTKKTITNNNDNDWTLETFDENGKIKTKEESDGSIDSWEYDSNGNCISKNNKEYWEYDCDQNLIAYYSYYPNPRSKRSASSKAL